MSFRVQLDTYSGPLDLLLYLVRRDEVDVRDIPIARSVSRLGNAPQGPFDYLAHVVTANAGIGIAF